MTVSSPAPGRAEARLTITEAHLNPNGVVHGAVLFALVDTGMGAAAMSLLEEAEACASIEVHLRFLVPCAAGEVVARPTVRRRGRRILHLDCEVVDEAGTLVALGTGSFAVVHLAQRER